MNNLAMNVLYWRSCTIFVVLFPAKQFHDAQIFK